MGRLRSDFDGEVGKRFRKLLNPHWRVRFKVQYPADKRERAFKKIIRSDDEFYVLHRSSAMLATWLSALSVSLLYELLEDDSDMPGRVDKAAALSFFSRLSSDLWAILELIERGFDLQARALTRSYLEHVDVLICCIDNFQFTESFVDTGDTKEANEFWHMHVSKNRSKKMVSAIVSDLIGVERATIVDILREDADQAGSWALHPTIIAGFAAALGDAETDYDSYPVFPTPMRASQGILRSILCHLLWLRMVMGPLPFEEHRAWGALLRKRSQGDFAIDRLSLLCGNALGFLIDRQILMVANEEQ